MRMPNGFGSVCKLGGKRRKPYAARKTIGYNDNGSPKYLYIGYFLTKKDAINALSQYNINPYEVGVDKYTFSQVYKMWSDEAYETMPFKTAQNYRAAYRIAEPLHDLRMMDIKLDHLQETIDNSGKNEPTLKKYRSLINSVFDYAMKHEYITKDKREIARYMDIKKGNPNKITREIFSKKEIDNLLKNDDNKWIQMILILIYSGLRIGEMMDLKKEDVHLDEKYFFIRASKTESGIRDVPIADKIMPYVKKWLKNDSEYLVCTDKGGHLNYRNYIDAYWKPFAGDHRPHDTRHTCDSLMVMAKVDDRWKQAILGHKLKGLDAVYTHIDLEHKLEAINRI